MPLRSPLALGGDSGGWREQKRAAQLSRPRRARASNVFLYNDVCRPSAKITAMRTGLDSDAHRSGLEARLCPRAPGGLGGARGASPALRTPHPDGGADPPGLPLPAPPPGQGAQSPDVKASSTLTLALSLSTRPEEREGRSRHLHQCLAVAPWRYSFLPQTVGENSSASPVLTAGCEQLSARGEPPSPGWASPSLLQTRPSARPCPPLGSLQTPGALRGLLRSRGVPAPHWGPPLDLGWETPSLLSPVSRTLFLLRPKSR